MIRTSIQSTLNRESKSERAAVMDRMRRWIVVTTVAIPVIQAVDILARFLTERGWIFGFVFVLGAPVWLLNFALLAWMARGMLSATSAFAEAKQFTRVGILLLLWVYALGSTLFCWFAEDGDAFRTWQSPAGRLLGVDGSGGHSPQYLQYAQGFGMAGLALGFLALVAAGSVYATIGVRVPVPTPARPAPRSVLD
ncbi:hypothetical protein V7968_01670 [Nocardia vulneris]|uniref:hypothetical protein n=1 Tax=Nocardia vulneris TaxID=1141657 RepID=UPI0030D5A9B6